MTSRDGLVLAEKSNSCGASRWLWALVSDLDLGVELKLKLDWYGFALFTIIGTTIALPLS